MSNRLRSATSPYLLQHALNPVDWYPWGDEALARAESEDKPIFLSIGYAACHWCHVMAHESFEDEQTAALLNAHFVNIKVDREERPDLDSIYMQAVVGLTGGGGWPLSVFLTPQGQPFFGGTYWPPQPRHGLPAFRDVLQRVAEAWRDRRQAVLRAGAELTLALKTRQPRGLAGADLNPRLPELASEALLRTYDWQFGGWGDAPKFPMPMAVDFLLRLARMKQDRSALDAACHALTSMADGGIHDQIGGGFHRYSIDARWTVPHFEKMLCDNVLLARAYLHAWQLTAVPRFRAVLDSILTFLMREMRHPSGGFFASLDADSADGEGSYYLWTYEEAREVLQDHPPREFALAVLGLTPAGNFEGRTVLRRPADLDACAAAHGIPATDASSCLQTAAEALRARRSQRPRPAVDDKIIAEWNGLGLLALSEAARATGSAGYHKAALSLAAFLADQMVEGDRVRRTWRDGHLGRFGLLADHAALAMAFLAQYQTDFNLRWFDLAERILDGIVRRFSGNLGELFDTPADHEALVLKPRSMEDSPTPSGSSMTAMALLQLADLTAETRYRALAESILRHIPTGASEYPAAFAHWLSAADAALQPSRQLAVVGQLDDPSLRRLVAVAGARFEPHMVVAAGQGDRPWLLHGRVMRDGAPTAYLCRDFACLLPTTDPADLTRQLEASSPVD